MTAALPILRLAITCRESVVWLQPVTEEEYRREATK